MSAAEFTPTVPHGLVAGPENCHDDHMLKLQGAIPANIMPFDSAGRIDERQYREHIAWLASVPGLGGITCNGHAAEVAALDREERRRAVALACETVGGRVPVIAGIYAENHVQAVTLARDAAAEGAAALLVFPLNNLVFGAAPQVTHDHFAELAGASELPLVVFQYPARTGMQYDEDTLRGLLEIDKVIAVKEWSLDIAVYERTYRLTRSAGHHVALLSSFSTSLLPSLVVGADGILSGHGSVIADLHAELLNTVGNGDLAACRNLYDRIQVLTRAVYRQPMASMYARMKAQLVMLGRLDTMDSRPPIPQLSPAELGSLREALIQAGLLEAGMG
jgi:4-hydroxy-tetrahydrodipicolinate synthase